MELETPVRRVPEGTPCTGVYPMAELTGQFTQPRSARAARVPRVDVPLLEVPLRDVSDEVP